MKENIYWLEIKSIVNIWLYPVRAKSRFVHKWIYVIKCQHAEKFAADIFVGKFGS